MKKKYYLTYIIFIHEKNEKGRQKSKIQNTKKNKKKQGPEQNK